MSKIAGHLIWLSLLGFHLAGCAQSTPPKLVLAVGGAPAELDFWEQVIADFEAEQHIRVELLRQPTDSDQRRQNLVIPLKTRKSDPDVFLMDVAWIAQFAASNWLADLDELSAGTLDKAVFFQGVLKSADHYQDRLIALPVYIDGGVLYYRQDLLKQMHDPAAPETWAELIRMSTAAQKTFRGKDPAFTGFVWQGAQYEGLVCNFLEFAGSNRGGILFRDHRIVINTPENREALQLMYDLIHTAKVSPKNTFSEMKEEEVRLHFQAGHALFERNWPYAWPLHQADDSKIKGRVGIAPLPHFKNGKSRATLGGWHVGVSRFSDLKSQSLQLAAYITSYAVQKKLALNLGWNPGRQDVYQDPEILKALPHFLALRAVFENAVPRPNLPYYTQISIILQKHLNSVLSQQAAAGDALAAAEKAAQAVVDQYPDQAP